tara:strand:+ start:1015 stop:1224 length:210 start_codon:yes stop_codon:yes gene_type:complete
MEFAVFLGLILLLIMIGLLIIFLLQDDSKKLDLVNNYDGNEDSRVIEEMAKRIINDARMHRKNRFNEEE